MDFTIQALKSNNLTIILSALGTLLNLTHGSYTEIEVRVFSNVSTNSSLVYEIYSLLSI